MSFHLGYLNARLVDHKLLCFVVFSLKRIILLYVYVIVVACFGIAVFFLHIKIDIFHTKYPMNISFIHFSC